MDDGKGFSTEREERMKEGLVAPQWSDAGPVPVGEVTYWPGVTVVSEDGRKWTPVDAYQMPGGQVSIGYVLAKPSDPNAKPSLPALGRVAGEDYRGLGWCDE